MTVLDEVRAERARQDARWGEQNHPDGTGDPVHQALADGARRACDGAFERGEGTYRHILSEEVCEAFAESDHAKLRTELIQVAAVAVAWVEKLDREHASRPGVEKFVAHPLPVPHAIGPGFDANGSPVEGCHVCGVRPVPAPSASLCALCSTQSGAW